MKRPLIFAGAVLLCAQAPAPAVPDDLAWYGQTTLIGMHGHSFGWDGRQIERAEKRIAARQAKVRDWLVGRYGEDVVSKLEDDLRDEAHGVYWTSAPTDEQEWNGIRYANKALAVLERKMKAEGAR